MSSSTKKGILIFVGVVAIFVIAIIMYFTLRPKPVEIDASTFYERLSDQRDNGRDAKKPISTINIINDRIEIKYRNTTGKAYDEFLFARSYIEQDVNDLYNALLNAVKPAVYDAVYNVYGDVNPADPYDPNSVYGDDGELKGNTEDALTEELETKYGTEGTADYIEDPTERQEKIDEIFAIEAPKRVTKAYADAYDKAYKAAYKEYADAYWAGSDDEIANANAAKAAYEKAAEEKPAYKAAYEKASAAEKENHRFSIVFNDRNAVSAWSFIYPIGLVILIAIVGIFLFRSINGQNKQTMSFGKTKAASQSSSKVRFTDVAGAEEEKVELQEIVEFLKSPAKFTKVGARIPRGVLLVGPPGTGKTLFAKAVAGEANVPFFSISGSDFVEMFVGVGASRVRDLFDQAKKNMPCIVFIDEIDAVGRQRGAGLGGGHDEREQTLNQLLVQMDGFETNEGIIVMAATNRADILDPALLRPGRFDRQIYVHIPDVRGREAIFKVHSRNKPVAPDVDFQILARITSGFSGADIENLLNEAAILCARDNRTLINMNDINEGINKVILGPQKKSRLVTEADRRITAYHEVGHAVVGKLCKFCGPVHEVSIIPRGNAGGYTMSRPEDDNRYESVNKLKDHLARIMGGRAAEELVIQDITSGAVGDFQTATEIAKKMVMEWGMSGNKKLGQVFYGSNQEVFLGRDYQSTHNYSEDTASEIDREINRITDEAYRRALDLLSKNRDKMDVMARVLLECETIYTEEVDMIMDGKSFEEVRDGLNDRLKKKYEKPAPPPSSAKTPPAAPTEPAPAAE